MAASLDFASLEQRLAELPSTERRGVQALLALAVGDAAGLPFELSAHWHNRRRADEVAKTENAAKLQRLVLELVVERLGTGGAQNAHARTFSDDTVCTDLKMAAIALSSELLKRPSYSAVDPGDLLWKCLLAQLLAWSQNAGGSLFQGYGGFTRGLLRPQLARGDATSLELPEGLKGCRTWPEEWFVRYAENYCEGVTPGIEKSYGNGALMSYAPQALAEVLSKRATCSSDDHVPPPPSILAVPLQRLASTHRHKDAMEGMQLLEAVFGITLQGQIQSCDELRKAVRDCSCWAALMQSTLVDHPAYPLRAFDSFLHNGDCSQAEFNTFLLLFASAHEHPPAAAPISGAYTSNHLEGILMGQLLRTAANWDDDNEERRSKVSLEGGEAIRFSQRGLNAVLIAVWCCCGARKCWDWISRLIYVGGDSDTVGAICGQIAGPMLPTDDVCRSFRFFVAVDCGVRRPCADVAHAAARRYFSRALSFCSGAWENLSVSERLVDPVYEGLTDSEGCRTNWSTPLQVLWVDAWAGGPGHRRWRAVEDVERRGLLRVQRVEQIPAAVEALQRAKSGGAGEALHAVVTELHFTQSRRDSMGLELLQYIESIWGTERASRPLYVLMTPSHDRQVSSLVRSKPRTVLARHDQPDAIIQAVMTGPCTAIILPESLPAL